MHSKERALNLLDYYKSGYIEQQIKRIYQQHAILAPRDLSLKNLARVFHIDILYNPIASFTVWDNEVCLMNLKEGLNEFSYKKHFFHELCHRIDHIGNQMYLPHHMETLMEKEARHFVPIAMMPFFMIANWEPESVSDPYTLSTIFDVPVAYAEARLRFIYEQAETFYLYEREKQFYSL